MIPIPLSKYLIDTKAGVNAEFLVRSVDRGNGE